METLFTVVHVTIAFLLIFIVLIQGGKGATLGAAFGGGGSQTVFGGRGAATFLNKMTTVVAVVFMFTSLILAIMAVRGTSIITQPPPASQSAPAGQATIPDGPIAPGAFSPAPQDSPPAK